MRKRQERKPWIVYKEAAGSTIMLFGFVFFFSTHKHTQFASAAAAAVA